MSLCNAGDHSIGGHSSDLVAENEKAKSLALPLRHDENTRNNWNLPEPCLLVTDTWIANHAPNIWWLILGKLEVSEDGRRATRELTARLKLCCEQDRRSYENEELDSEDDVWDYETVEYLFPPSAEECRKQIFARERHIEKMRQREVAAIRRLDGEADCIYREKRSRAREERACR